MKYRAYPNYRPSGVEWMGEVPEHWDVKRLKTSINYRVSNVDKVPSENELPVRLCNYTDVYNNDRIHLQLNLMETTATSFEIEKFGLRIGDILITKDSEDWRDIAVPAIVIETSPNLVCGYHLAIIRPKPRAFNSSFLLRAFQSCAINQQFQVASTGVTRYGLPKNSIGDAIFPVPSDQEQNTIAKFLDDKTANIDTLVGKKRALIEKLKEKRTALMSCTVTRGLPPDAARAAGLDPQPKLKPSGVEWLGDMPDHWEIKRLSYMAILKSGESITFEQIVESGEYPVFGGNGLRGYYSDYTHNGEYILIGRQGALCGNINYATGKFWASEHAVVVNPLEPFANKWLGELLRAMNLNQYSVSAAQPGLSVSIIGALKVPVPPTKEQHNIAAFLDIETAKIDQLIAKVESAIECLQEYRTALITAAVTGKIDVRQEASRYSRTNTDSHGWAENDSDGHGQAEITGAGHG